MKETLKKVCDRLLKVDSIMTLTFTFVVAVKAVRNDFDISEIFYMIVGSYFVKNSIKNNNT